MRIRNRVIAFAAFVTAMSLVGPSEAAQIAPVRIFGGRTDQIQPGANANYIVWSHNTLASPHHYDAYAEALVGGVPTGSPTKLNTGKSIGFAGGIRPDANEAVFQQVNRRRTQSNVLVVDLDTLPLTPTAPPGLNTPNLEWLPAISTDWILFARNNRTNTRNGIFLYDRASFKTIKLASAKNTRRGDARVWPESVSETYATWTTIGSGGSNVHYYNLSTKVTSVVAKPESAPFFYGSAVSDATGDMYFVRAGKECGVKVRILRWHIGDALPYVVVSSLPAGYDSLFRTSTFNDGAHDNVYFDRIRCAGKYYSDIYEVPAADTAS
jgi:hypothetical protein